MTETASDLYTFDYEGETYTFEKPFSVVRAPGFLRANRRRDELDLAFTILEEIAGDEVLALIDRMSDEEFRAFSLDVNKAMGASFQ